MRLVLDWDGTVTERDTLVMLLEEFRRPLPDGSRSFRQVMENEMATLTAPLPDAVAWLVEHARVRPGFEELVRTHKPLVVSSSFEETIRPILAREEIDVELVANRVDARPDGWRVLWRDDGACPECGDVCKRSALPDPPFAYAGDGWSDHCPAVAADRVFARDGLAGYLDERRIPYEPFEDLHDVARALTYPRRPRRR